MSMTEYRAMCAELVDALAEWRLGGGPPEDTADADLIARARALLAQPVAEGPADGEVGKRVAWLRAFANGERHEGRPATSQILARTADLLERFASPACLMIDPGREALAASIVANLAGPVRLAEMEPADGAVLVPAAQPVAEGPTDEELNTFWNCSGIADEHGNHTGNIFEFARAVLAKWGRPTPQPVAVRERLPGPEDCDEQGRCWIFMPDIGIDPSWRLANPLYIPPYHTHWLPANALPTPEATNG